MVKLCGWAFLEQLQRIQLVPLFKHTPLAQQHGLASNAHIEYRYARLP